MKAYLATVESPAGPLAFAVDQDGALIRLHFAESDFGSAVVMERELEDEGYVVESDEVMTGPVRR
ncbi:MAG: hypothetical protein ACLGI3_01255, partial [Actinomycetes bacterium]